MPHTLSSPVHIRDNIQALKAYVPGLSIDEIREKYACERIVKMASNENPLGVSPLVQEQLCRHAASVFRYPQGGNPRLVKALATRHDVSEKCLVLGNGSDEIIDLLMRVRCVPGEHNIVCFQPCFSMYVVQGHINDIALRHVPLNEDFSFSFEALRARVNEKTALVFLTTPDNPSGYCPLPDEVMSFAQSLPKGCLLVIDEAYMDFADEKVFSLLSREQNVVNTLPNVAFLRTFSKSYGLAGIRLGYGIMPEPLADALWRTRMPFSVNILAEEAGLAALEDMVFYEKTLQVVREGREQLTSLLQHMGCTVWPSVANFLMFALPQTPHTANIITAQSVFEALLHKGFIIRPLKSYGLPHLLRISVGTAEENAAFGQAMQVILS